MARRQSLEVRPPANDREFRALGDLDHQAFAGFGQSREAADRLFNHFGRENLRIAKRGKQIVGGLGILFFGQWFGGQRIASAGISSVAVAPEARGTGVGTEMMRAVVAQLHARGVPLSSLYPSTYPLYRNAGYECAGQRVSCALDVHKLGANDRDRTIRPMTPADRKALADLHRAFGRRSNGIVDRTPREWTWVLDFAPDPVYAYVIDAPGRGRGLEGYIIYTQHHRPRAPYEIKVRDLAFLTPAAGRRLLSFFADHGTMAGHVVYDGPLNDPLLAPARFKALEVRSTEWWMLRVTDVAAALRQRGYPLGLGAELHLEISDDLIPANHGRFVLRVGDGAARVRKGGRGRLTLDVRGLAPLFTGHLSATQLALVGMIEGDESELARADAVFAGPPPWMNERF